MKLCPHCGKEILDQAVVCIGCGCAVGSIPYTQQPPTYQYPPYTPPVYTQPPVEDRPSVGLNILAFLVPLAGLIMYCTMNSATPKKAKQIGICALVGFILGNVLSVLVWILVNVGYALLFTL